MVCECVYGRTNISANVPRRVAKPVFMCAHAHGQVFLKIYTQKNSKT